MLFSYGSYLEILIGYMIKNNVTWPGIRVILFGADALRPTVRKVIEETFQCPVYGEYVSSEFSVIGFECEAHQGYHLNTDICCVDVIDANDEPVDAGEKGELIISNLFNKATVLLNYRMGDLAVKGGNDCPCGRTLPMINELIGKIDDVVSLPNGHQLTRRSFNMVFLERKDIYQYQIIQESLDTVVMKVVTPRKDIDVFSRELKRDLRLILPPEVAVGIECVDHVKPEKSGKIKMVKRCFD